MMPSVEDIALQLMGNISSTVAGSIDVLDLYWLI